MKTKKIETGFQIGAAARRTGTSVSALRFYEAKGLVKTERSRGGNRVFLASDIRRISFIIIAQKLGFSLSEIKFQLDQLPNDRTPTKADWEKISRLFRADIDARIVGLTCLRDRLSNCIGCGCLSLKACAIYNHNDMAAKKGAGPRYLLGDKPNKMTL